MISHKTPQMENVPVSFLVRKKIVASFLLFLFIIINIFLSAEIISVVMFLFMLFWISTSPFHVPRGLWFLIGPLVVIMSLGLIGAGDNSLYNVLKDLWYISKPASALLIGYILMLHIRNLKDLFKIILAAAFIASLVHIFQFVQYPDLIGKSLTEIRETTGTGYFVCVLAIPVIMICSRRRILLFKKKRWFIKLTFVSSCLSVFLSYSRTIWISLLVMLLIVFGLLNFSRTKKILLFSFLALVFTIISLVTPEEERIGLNRTFTGKIAHSVQEVLIKDYEETRDIVSNWRGYEAFCAWRTFADGGWLQYFIGQGFGTLIDIGFYINIKGIEHRYLPILHNAYLYLLVKTGLIGLFIYLFYFFRLIVYGHSKSRLSEIPLQIAGYFIVAISVIIIITTFVISGFFNKSSLLPVIVVLGSLISYLRFSLSPHKLI